MKGFAAWLRQHYEFPVRVPVYLSAREKILTMNGDLVSASFVSPYDREAEPFIRISTGDYKDMKCGCGKYNALASTLCSLAHEVVHYSQWIRGVDLTERGVQVRAKGMVHRYLRTRSRSRLDWC